MNSFHLLIVSPDGKMFDGDAEMFSLRTTEGDVSIMAHHMNYVAAIGMGPAFIDAGGKRSYAVCIGGMVSVSDNSVYVTATNFEWVDELDKERAESAKAKAVRKLDSGTLNDIERGVYEAKLARAEVRLDCIDKYRDKK